MLAILLLAGLMKAGWAQDVPTYTVLYSFSGGDDGGSPYAGVIQDAAGNFYGTTFDGGAYDSGVVFELDASGHETVLHTFTGGTDGAEPLAGVIRDAAGNLYGTTQSGGLYGFGTVFKLHPSGVETVLHHFTRGADGGFPIAGVIRDRLGNLYGTTSEGGNTSCASGSGCGTVFKLDGSGKETVLHTFPGAGGIIPRAGVIRDAAGNLYGTTGVGGNPACNPPFGCGTVFKLDTTGKETVLHTFVGGTDGAYPLAAVIRDVVGNLYGTTEEGGAYGMGTVFKLDPSGHETVLYTFTGGTDGSFPVAGLIWDGAGNLYGTTYEGGTNGDGVVFKLAASGKESVLYSFTGGADGERPQAGVIGDAEGNLYGTTSGGGGDGVVFKISLK